MLLVGITGGIGSGKSAAGKRFAELGIPVLDADRIGHEVLMPGGMAEPEVREAFPNAVDAQGQLDREKLAGVVFQDADARARLNALTHPAIFSVITERCGALAEEGHGVVILEAALLGEGGRRDPWMHRLILVSCPEPVRLQRLIEHRGMSLADAQARLRAQSDPEDKVAIADFVIQNDGDIAHLHAQVDRLAEVLHAQAL